MEFQHELVIPDEGLPFKFFLFEGSQGNYVREKHWHTSVEIFAVMEGSLTFYLNDEKHPLKAGELMIINSNEVHSIDSPEENHTAVLQIPLKQFEDYFTDGCRILLFKCQRNRCGPHYVLQMDSVQLYPVDHPTGSAGDEIGRAHV